MLERSTSATRPTSCRASCPAGSSSASRSPARWSTNRAGGLRRAHRRARRQVGRGHGPAARSRRGGATARSSSSPTTTASSISPTASSSWRTGGSPTTAPKCRAREVADGPVRTPSPSFSRNILPVIAVIGSSAAFLIWRGLPDRRWRSRRKTPARATGALANAPRVAGAGVVEPSSEVDRPRHRLCRAWSPPCWCGRAIMSAAASRCSGSTTATSAPAWRSRGGHREASAPSPKRAPPKAPQAASCALPRHRRSGRRVPLGSDPGRGRGSGRPAAGASSPRPRLGAAAPRATGPGRARPPDGHRAHLGRDPARGRPPGRVRPGRTAGRQARRPTSRWARPARSTSASTSTRTKPRGSRSAARPSSARAARRSPGARPLRPRRAAGRAQALAHQQRRRAGRRARAAADLRASRHGRPVPGRPAGRRLHRRQARAGPAQGAGASEALLLWVPRASPLRLCAGPGPLPRQPK
jgi:hypothetical protein